MNAWPGVISFLRGSRDTEPWNGDAYLAPVRSRIGQLRAASPPDLVREIHVELLQAFGESIGVGFHPQPALESRTEDLITVFGRFDSRAGQRDFGLRLQFEETDDGRFIRVAWLIDLYIPERWRHRGAGTALMGALLEFWERIDVDEVRATAAGDGQAAFPSWGFEPAASEEPDRGLVPLRLELPRQDRPELLPL